VLVAPLSAAAASRGNTALAEQVAATLTDSATV
jgi:hypothetical protein